MEQMSVDPWAYWIAKLTDTEADRCPVCGGALSYTHDHKADNSGLDDGPWLPGKQPRKKPAPKSAEEMKRIRSQAWATRRAKYGPQGHR